jgi:hypothetical protein
MDELATIRIEGKAGKIMPVIVRKAKEKVG